MNQRIELDLAFPRHVTFTNGRQALVLAPDRLQPGVAAQLASFGLELAACGDPAAADRGCYATVLPVEPDRISGWLGRFRATLEIEGAERDLALSGNEHDLWDWIIDAHESPWFTDERTPPGYVHVPRGVLDPAALVALAEADQPECRKPVYVSYRSDRCAHSRRHIPGCSRCLEACPAGALQSSGRDITVQAELCHGCGICSLRCPTGAIRYARPELGDVLDASLEALHQAGGEADLAVRITSRELSPEPRVWNLQLPSVAAFGAELWLSLLAMGWSRVVLFVAGLPDSSQLAIEHELEHWNSLLDAPRIITSSAPSPEAAGTPSKLSPMARRVEPWLADKRRVISAALTRLVSDADDFIPRRPGFPLGRVAIDAERCSQCLACAQICPTGALKGGRGLEFTSIDCAQCGICEAGCPESAIRLEPGLEPNPAKRVAGETLFETDTAHCARCGAPIMAAGVLASLRRRLADDPAVDLQVLDLCGACRAEEAIPSRRSEP